MMMMMMMMMMVVMSLQTGCRRIERIEKEIAEKGGNFSETKFTYY